MVSVIKGGVVHHGRDHQVDVYPQRVVEDESDESQESEDVSDRKPCWSLHHYDFTEHMEVIKTKEDI